jgi:hypothetical protein
MARKKSRAIDQAREYRERVRALYEPAPLCESLAGLTHHRCERFVYLSLAEDENAGALHRDVFKHNKAYAYERGSLPACFSSAGWAVTLPTGETFHAFQVVRYPAMVGETEKQMVPFVEAGVSVLHAYATASDRQTATIESGTTFVCDDGRRIAIKECCCRPLTDEDYQSRRQTRRGPKPS